MNDRLKWGIHNANRLLNQPLTIVAVLLLLFAYFALGNAHFEQENRQLLTNTKQSVDNSNTIIKNLQQAVKDLKTDNEHQTRYIACLLALQGRPDLVPMDVQDQCTKMSLNVALDDVTNTTTVIQTPTNPQPTPPAPVTPPVKILGIQVCVPFTHICIDE